MWSRTVARNAATALAVAGTLSLLTACGSSSGPESVAASTSKEQLLAKANAGHPVPSGTSAEDFALRDQLGATVRLSGQRGKVTLLTFLYTHCVDVCPLIADQLNAVLRQLGPARKQARVLAVSVDPRYDTRQAVTQFVREHRLLPEFRYLRGTAAQLKPVWQAYNVLVISKSPDLMAHTASITLIDQGGRPRFVYPSTAGAQDILPDALQLLRTSS